MNEAKEISNFQEYQNKFWDQFTLKRKRIETKEWHFVRGNVFFIQRATRYGDYTEEVA